MYAQCFYHPGKGVQKMRRTTRNQKADSFSMHFGGVTNREETNVIPCHFTTSDRPPYYIQVKAATDGYLARQAFEASGLIQPLLQLACACC